MSLNLNCQLSYRRAVWLSLVIGGLGVVLRGCFFRPATTLPDAHFNRNTNAVWLGVEWVNEPHDQAEIEVLGVVH